MALAGEGKIVGVVFHSSCCEAIPEARLSYLGAVKRKGYTVVDLCASARSASQLKMDVEVEAEKQGIKWSDIGGVNIVRPVVSTILLPSLPENPKKNDAFCGRAHVR